MAKLTFASVQDQFAQIQLAITKKSGYQWLDHSGRGNHASNLQEAIDWLNRYKENLSVYIPQRLELSIPDAKKYTLEQVYNLLNPNAEPLRATIGQFEALQQKAEQNGFKLTAEDCTFILEYGKQSSFNAGLLADIDRQIDHLISMGYGNEPEAPKFYLVTHNQDFIEVFFSEPISQDLETKLKKDNYKRQGSQVWTRSYSSGEYEWIRHEDHWIVKAGYQLDKRIGFYPRGNGSIRGLTVDYYTDRGTLLKIVVSPTTGVGYWFKVICRAENWEYISDDCYGIKTLAEKAAIDWIEENYQPPSDDSDDSPKPEPPTPNDGGVEDLNLRSSEPDSTPYHLASFDHLRPGIGVKTKLEYNKQALRILHQCKAKGRTPTAEERDKLARYVGNGTIASAIDREYLDLTLDPQASLESDNAFQTSPEIIQAIWQALNNLGFSSGRILDPSANIGNFIGLQPPEHRSQSEWALVEINPDAVQIAKYLHTDAIAIYGSTSDNRIGFENADLPQESFDLIISNFPFGKTAPFDPKYIEFSLNLHNYFFLKSLDLLREGGLIAAITSSYTLDSSIEFCKLLRDRGANLIGAVRLPSSAFKAMHTEVTTDLLIFQKRRSGTVAPEDEWTDLDSFWLDGSDVELKLNSYYNYHPENILGTLTRSTLYAGEAIAVAPDGRDIAQAIIQAFSKVGRIYSPEKHPKSLKGVLLPDHLLGLNPYSFIEEDGKVYQYRPSEGLCLVEKHAQQIKAGITLRKDLIDLIEAEKQNLPCMDDRRQQLNRSYDAYVEKYGHLLNPRKRPSSLSLFRDDSELSAILYALEEEIPADPEAGTFTSSYRKADIFHQQVSGSLRTNSRNIQSAVDAAYASLNIFGRLDIGYIATLLDKDEEEAIAELQTNTVKRGEEEAIEPFIFWNPQAQAWEQKSEYLSGDTRAKLALICGIRDADSATYHQFSLHLNEKWLRDNLSPYLLPAATDAIRADIAHKLKQEYETESELDASIKIKAGLGSPWIEKEDIAKFTAELIGCSLDQIKVAHVAELALWAVNGPSYTAKTSEYSTKHLNAIELVQKGLNQQIPKVDIRDRDGKLIRDESEKATSNAIAQLDRIKERFQQWLWTDPERCWKYTILYNQTFPRPIRRKYDGSHLTLPNSNSTIKLRDIQLGSVARATADQRLFLLHEVGLGKTLEIICSAYEAKRIGKANKPLIVVLKATLSQFAQTYRAMYPNARLLIADEHSFNAENRNKLIAKIQTGNYDSILMTHEQFLSISLTAKTRSTYIQQELELLRQYVSETDKQERLLLTELNQQIDSLEATLEEIEIFDLIEQNSDNPQKLRKLLKQFAEEGKLEFEAATGKPKYKRKRGAKEQKQEDKANDRITRSVEKALGFYTRNTIKIKWEELGIDWLCFDEFQYLKNLRFSSKTHNLAGVTNTDTQRSLNALLKFHYTYNNGGFIAGATGTFPTNSIVELFTKLRFFAMDELRTTKTQHFDAWSGQFGEIRTELEFTSTGGIKPKSRLARFKNIPELVDMTALFTDFATVDMVNQVARSEGKPEPIQRPVPTRITITSPANPDQTAFNDFIAKCVQQLKNNQPPIYENKEGRIVEHNYLTLTSLGSLNAIDPRLVNPDAENYPDSKVNKLVHNIWQIWKASESVNATQMIFCDGSTPKADGYLNMHYYMRDALIALGIPSEQIALIHEHEGKKRPKLYDDMNSGRKRILIATTRKGGTGVNAQRLLIAMHHLDIDWTPANMEQRNGRIIRQGNLFSQCLIFQYGTQGQGDQPGFDAYKSKLVQTKAEFIYKYNTGGKDLGREAEDIGEDASSYMMAAAVLSGNTDALEHAKVADKIRKIQADLNQQRSSLVAKLSDQKSLDDSRTQEKLALVAALADRQAVESCGDLVGGSFKMIVDGQTFTKPAKAGEALLFQINTIIQQKIPVKDRVIGQYAGLPIVVDYSGGKRPDFFGLQGQAYESKNSRSGFRRHYYSAYSSDSPTGIVQSLRSSVEKEILNTSEGWRRPEFQKHQEAIAEYDRLEGILPGQIKNLTETVATLEAQIAPLLAQELELRTRLMAEKMEEQKQPEAEDKKKVTAALASPYRLPELAIIEEIQSLGEPTAQDADGNTITWIPQVRSLCLLLADRLANPEPAPAPEIEQVREQLEQQWSQESIPAVQAESSQVEEKSEEPEKATPTSQVKKLKRKVTPQQPKPAQPSDKVVSLTERRQRKADQVKPRVLQQPQDRPLTQAQINRALRSIAKTTQKQFSSLGYGSDAVDRVVEAAIEAAKRELGLVVEIDGWRYEDTTLRKGKAVGVAQGCLF